MVEIKILLSYNSQVAVAMTTLIWVFLHSICESKVGNPYHFGLFNYFSCMMGKSFFMSFYLFISLLTTHTFNEA